MKLMKNFWARAVPVFFIILITLLVSRTVYNQMVEYEKENCWERLEIATESTAEKIRVRLNDNLSFLEAVSDSYVLKYKLEDAETVGNYLNAVMESTIFARIDVLLPDGSMLTQTGEVVDGQGELSYEELLEKGTHISPRMTNPFNNREVLYCFTVIESEGEVRGLLCGTLDCITLSDIFEVFTYKGDAQLFLIDCEDGNYLIDNWHGSLGNIYDIGIRTNIDGKEMIDMVPPIINRESGCMSFISRTNGENSYQCYTPVQDFNWELCVVVQEDIAFAHVNGLQDMLMIVGVVEIVLLSLYLVWTIWLTLGAAKSEQQNKKLQMEKATNEARAKFISNMSHDVRTPLNGIAGMLHIIKTHRNDEKLVDECLNKIEISAQYLTTLTNDMLDINELESNKFILQNISFDLCKLAEELQVMIEQKALKGNVNYHMDYSKLKNSKVSGSPIHIQRILMNLIDNAIKYNKEEGGCVWVTIEEDESNGKQGNYRFTVRDNGIGMTEEFQENMYNAFEQEKEVVRSNYQGYGLGLTIVNKLVKKMKGTIQLDSVKGEGSTFVVTLPLKIDTTVADEKEKEAVVTDLKGMRILLAEDNDFNREIAEIILADAGAVVTTAIDGKLVTEIFAESEPGYYDLILMDLMMPKMDGCEATEAIRAMNRPDAGTIPIIAMTASAFAEEINRCKEAGMNEHIAKPLDIDNLMLRIAKYGD